MGDSFKIFYAANCSGAFENLVPAIPGVGLVWNTGSLATDGTVAVALGAVQPRIAQIFLSGTNLAWTGYGGAAGAPFSIISSSDLTLPLAAWNVLGAGVFNATGNFAVTNGISAASPARFYSIRNP